MITDDTLKRTDPPSTPVWEIFIVETRRYVCSRGAVFYKIILTTSTVSLTILWPTLIFASCVVGTCSILDYVFVRMIVRAVGGMI